MVIRHLRKTSKPDMASILPGIAVRPGASGTTAGEPSRSAKGDTLQRLRNLVSPFLSSSLPFLISRSLAVLLYAAAPGILATQNSPANDKQEGMVQAQMRNVSYHFSDAVVVNIKSLNGELVPVGKNEFPVFDDRTSFNLRISTAEISIDSSSLPNILNSYVFARPNSPLTELSIIVEGGHLKVKGKLHDKGDIPFETEGILTPTADGKLRLHSEKIKAMHVPVKGLMGLFGIDLGSLIKEGKVPGVQAQGDELLIDLEQILPPPILKARWSL